ncbi:MAG: hydroxymethylglutaryl-CoA synthase family protein [Chloroflexi bacterium]|nr:MAG: hydroxymethylglutaryl-CoA synthase family protein [Chloroflexota bacterium]
MTIGIVDFGMYIPHYRVSRAEIGEAWKLEQAKPLLIGERAVAGYDEDSLTMAVEAAWHALEGHDPAAVDGLLFASTTPPFAEKSSAAVIAAACDTAVSRTLDITTSLRAGTAALGLGLDMLRAHSAEQVLVTIADMRRPEPGTLLDAISGDGAAAFLLGRGENVLAELVGAFHLSDPVIDTWRRSDDRYLQTDDEAFTNQVGYFSLVQQAVKGLLAETAVDPARVKGVAIYAPDGRAYMKMAKKSPLGMAFMQMGMEGPAPYLLMHAGNLGAAFAPAQLALLLEKASPDDYLVLVGYGDGADAYLFRVTEAIKGRPEKRPLSAWINTKSQLPYNLALYFRENLRQKPLFPPDVDPWTSLPLLHRERNELLRFHAQKCNNCGALWWPHRPNCYDCGEQHNFSTVRLSRRGTVASFVAEWAIPTPVPPVGMITVDTAEGARITNPSTDGDPRQLTVGDEVEFALRIFHTARKLPHYSWKVRKLRV